MGLYYDNRTPLRKALDERKTKHHHKHDIVNKNSYDLRVAVEEGKGIEMWWNPNATGGPLLRVISPFNVAKVLFLRVVNHTKDDPAPQASKITITAQLNATDFDRRPDNEPMPRNQPKRGIDGIAFITDTRPVDITADSEMGSDPRDVAQGTTTDEPINRQLGTDGGGGVKINKFGAHIIGANGKGIHMGKGGIYMSEPVDSHHAPSDGFLVESQVKRMGVPECIVTIPAWEKWPHIERIISWANIAGYIFQAVSKIYRAEQAFDEENQGGPLT